MKQKNNLLKVFKPIIYFLLLGQCLSCYSQDIIVTKAEKRINAKVTEVNVDNIRYYEYDNQTGPVYTILKSDVVTIIYKNGKVENYNTSSPQTVKESNSAVSDKQDVSSNEQTDKKPNLTVSDNQFVNLNDMTNDEIELFFKNNNYTDLYNQFHKGMKLRRVGQGLTGFGLLSISIGFTIYDNAKTIGGVAFGRVLIVAGIPVSAVGIPLWAVGAGQRRRAKNNYSEMYNKTSDFQPYLQFNVNSNGVGLAYVF
ncbi:hypothetical protein FACS189434_05690 [Bacteroidia bacterium]|nr:hypothetical protein FACS189434_05690 [Bacteroidia bacterium]